MNNSTEPKLTHFDNAGRAKMVDIGAKDDTTRVATATGTITMKAATLEMVENGKAAKGDVLCVAQVAGIMSAKKTSDIIPMCHNIPLKGVDMDFAIEKATNTIHISATVSCLGGTGVEMEALHAVTVAALTIYDMCKAVDKEMVIGNVCVLEKSGGKSGHYVKKSKEPSL